MYPYIFVCVLASPDISLSEFCQMFLFYTVLRVCLLTCFLLKRERKTKKVWDFIIREGEMI